MILCVSSPCSGTCIHGSKCDHHPREPSGGHLRIFQFLSVRLSSFSASKARLFLLMTVVPGMFPSSPREGLPFLKRMLQYPGDVKHENGAFIANVRGARYAGDFKEPGKRFCYDIKLFDQTVDYYAKAVFRKPDYYPVTDASASPGF